MAARTSARLVRQTKTTALFRVRDPKGTRGHLKVSGGGLVWWPRAAKKTSFRQTWNALEKATEAGAGWSKRKGRSDPR